MLQHEQTLEICWLKDLRPKAVREIVEVSGCQQGRRGWDVSV